MPRRLRPACWCALDLPCAAASGNATIALRFDGYGIAVGGVIRNDSIPLDDVALTSGASAGALRPL